MEKPSTTPSDFTRGAMVDAMPKIDHEELDRRHREGYERHPVRAGEFDAWEDEQVWVE